MSAEVLKQEGNEAYRQEQWLRAAALYQKAAKASPGEHTLHSNLSAALLKLGKAQKALDSATTCVHLEESFAKGHYRRGLALEAQDRRQEALSAYERALALGPSREVEVKVRVLTKQLRDARAANAC